MIGNGKVTFIMRHMISCEEAIREVLENPPELTVVKEPILDSLNYILAEDIISNDDIPANDNSAMDGFAVILKDLTGADKTYPIALKKYDYDIPAGEYTKFVVKKGFCIKIMTGAPVPQGCDCIVKKEDVQIKEDKVLFFKEYKYFENIRHKGEDIKKGEAVFGKGHRIDPAAMGVFASLGIKDVPIYKPPLVGIISTGNELIGINDKLLFGMVRDSNSYSLAAQVVESGAKYIRYGIVKDNKRDLKVAVKKAITECDLILISGGVSVGDYDYIKEILNESGAQEIFWGVKQKPGKPLTFYKSDGKPIFGLPGNPVSVMVCFELYVRPLIRKMMGGKDLFRKTISAKALHSFKHEPGRTEFVRVKIKKDKDNNYFAEITGEQGSGILTSMAQADGIAEIEENKKDITEGENLKVYVIKYDL